MQNFHGENKVIVCGLNKCNRPIGRVWYKVSSTCFVFIMMNMLGKVGVHKINTIVGSLHFIFDPRAPKTIGLVHSLM